MKRIITIAILALTGILGIGSGLAQAAAVRVKVPFAFIAGDKPLPPGMYTITLVSSDVIRIQDQAQHVSVLTTEMRDNRQSENGDELVFVKVGNRYFLQEILCDSAAMNVNLPETRSEERARTQEAFLQNSTKVLLAAR